jgi:hypothetical protein
MKKLVAISFVLTAMMLAGPAQAVDVVYNVPWWDDTALPGDGEVSGDYGSTWWVARRDGGGGNNIGDNSDPPGGPGAPGTDGLVWDGSKWDYDNQTNPPTYKDGQNSGDAMYQNAGAGKEMRTEGIWNQFPRPALIFKPAVAGNYSLKGDIKFDWWATGTPHPTQYAQLRAYFATFTSATGPEGTHTMTYHTTAGASWPGFDQTTGSYTLDLDGIAAAQNIALGADDYIEFWCGNRGLLYGGVEEIDAWGNMSAKLEINPQDLFRIEGPIPEPATFAVLGLGALLGLLRRRRS